MIATIGFYRRLRYPEQEQAQSSVHAIMRYTLRLLTSHQADRLVRLVGAMNAVATDEDEHHNFQPFRVGMWIGSSASPNRLLTDDYAASAEENLVAWPTTCQKKKAPLSSLKYVHGVVLQTLLNTKTGALERSTTTLLFTAVVRMNRACSTSGFLSRALMMIFTLIHPRCCSQRRINSHKWPETLGQEALTLTNCLKLPEHTTRAISLVLGCEPTS